MTMTTFLPHIQLIAAGEHWTATIAPTNTDDPRVTLCLNIPVAAACGPGPWRLHIGRGLDFGSHMTFHVTVSRDGGPLGSTPPEKRKRTRRRPRPPAQPSAALTKALTALLDDPVGTSESARP